jgi:chromosome segregation ATPase
MGLGQCSYCGDIHHDSEDCGIRVAERSKDREIARLTAELAARTEERDAALTLAEPLDRLYEWAKRTIRADIQSPMEIMGEYESLREERDGMLAQIRALNRAATEIQGERDGMAAALNSLQSAARAVAHYHRTGYGPEVHRRFHDLIDHLDAMAAQTEAATVKEFSKVQPEGGEHA